MSAWPRVVFKWCSDMEQKQPTFSPREVSALVMLAQGKHQKHMAREFGISLNTTKDVMRRVYLKMRVNNAAEAVAQAIRAGII